MKTTRTQLTLIMNSAWSLARYGVEKFGGNVKEYFSIALKISWEKSRKKDIVVKSKKHMTRHLLPGINISKIYSKQLVLPGLTLK